MDVLCLAPLFGISIGIVLIRFQPQAPASGDVSTRTEGFPFQSGALGAGAASTPADPFAQFGSGLMASSTSNTSTGTPAALPSATPSGDFLGL